MRNAFYLVAIGLAIAPSLALAENKQSHTFADAASGYTQQQLQAFNKEGRMPVTPKYRGIFDTRLGSVDPYLIQSTFCGDKGELFHTTFNFQGTADQIASALSKDRSGFYRNLDKRAGQLDSYLRQHFKNRDAVNSEALLDFLNRAQKGMTTKGQFNPLLAGSVKSIPDGCFVS